MTNNRTSVKSVDSALPKGISRRTRLPNAGLGELWESIIIDPEVKKRLVSQAVLNFTVRGKVPRAALPLHGVILLVGKPGTGKTSLALGLANRTAESLKGASFTLLEVEPHSLTSSAMGKTQRAVLDLFSVAIAEAASDRYSSRDRCGASSTRCAGRAFAEPALCRHK